VQESLSAAALSRAALFDPEAVTRLWSKLRSQGPEGQFSNADNMGLIGVLSAQVLHHQFIARALPDPGPVALGVAEDRLPGRA
jgi:asparagine synthase (glutamine-hydrolysing)